MCVDHILVLKRCGLLVFQYRSAEHAPAQVRTLEYLFNDHGRLIFRGKSLFSVMKQKSYVVLCSKVVAK